MKKIYGIGRILIAFVAASYFTTIFYRDLFVTSEHNKLLFLIWGLPCLHLVVASLRLMAMFTGRQYRQYKNFSIVATHSILKHKHFLRQIIRRYFFAITINNKERIVSGLFWHRPTSIFVYTDTFNRLKTFTSGGLLLKVMWVLGNLTVLSILKPFIIRISS